MNNIDVSGSLVIHDQDNRVHQNVPFWYFLVRKQNND